MCARERRGGDKTRIGTCLEERFVAETRLKYKVKFSFHAISSLRSALRLEGLFILTNLWNDLLQGIIVFEGSMDFGVSKFG